MQQEPLRWNSVQHLPATKADQQLEVPVEEVLGGGGAGWRRCWLEGLDWVCEHLISLECDVPG